MPNIFYKYADEIYITACVVLLIVQLVVIALSFKFRSDGGVSFGLVLTALCVLFACNFPFNIDIVTALIGGIAVFLYGLIFFFTLLARAFWAEDWKNTTVWIVLFYLCIAVGLIALLIYVFT